MYHYCYKMYYEGGLYYIGKRSSQVEPELDEYRGSGSNLRGMTPTSKEILGVYQTCEEALEAEIGFIGGRHKTDDKCLNITRGGAGAKDIHFTDAVRDNVSRGRTGKGLGNVSPNKGKPISEGQRKKQSESMKGRISRPAGWNHSQESKEATSRNKKGFKSFANLKNLRVQQFETAPSGDWVPYNNRWGVPAALRHLYPKEIFNNPLLTPYC